jgi:uncharacterized protein (DUF2336 family)
LGGKRLVILHKLRRKPLFAKRLRIEHLGEPTAIVAKAAGLDQLDVTKRRIENLHGLDSIGRPDAHRDTP